MKTLAAVLVETGKPLELAEIEVPLLKTGQVLVEIAYSGVCHTQVLECLGHRGEDKWLPHCLGHEGSGTVLESGAGVTKVKPGDRVVLSWMKGKGADAPGSVYRWSDRNVNAGPITTFSRHSVISENRLTLIPEGISMQEAALMGCAVPTGLGVVFNTLRPKAGQSMAVFGIGGIGLCSIVAAAISGCVPLIAVDISAHKLDLAISMGATHAVNASRDDAVDELMKISPGGLDFAVEASGVPDVMRQALQVVRVRGGIAAIVGNARHGEFVQIDPNQFNLGKQIRGSWGGENLPDEDFPRYFRLMKAGRINLEPFLSSVYALPQINDAIHHLDRGQVVRPLVDMRLT